jgi:hypothetical protein
MIRLTVRSFAELLHLPAHAQVRILNEQKYPRREPQVFKVPFYQVAVTGIRDYYISEGDPRRLAAAKLKAGHLRPPQKRTSNERAIRAFERGSQSRRRILPTPSHTYRAQLPRDIELRVRFDIEGIENGRPQHILYNLRNVPVDPDVAATALHIAYWVLGENAVVAPIRTLQFVDLLTDDTYSVSRQSQRTLRLMQENAQIIEALWATL